MPVVSSPCAPACADADVPHPSGWLFAPPGAPALRACAGFAAESLPAPPPLAGGSMTAPEQPALMTNAINEAIVNPNGKIEYDYANHERLVNIPGDESKRAFTYMVLTAGRMVYASSIRLAVLQFLMSMSASADVLALANVEVGLDNIAEGQTVTIKWRGKPVFIRHRTAESVADARAVELGELRDPESDESRVRGDEKWLVVLGVCTHLGCVPLPDAGDYGGWFCPCHGSHYDGSGRIRKGPAPYNLEVPEYSFLDENTLVIG